MARERQTSIILLDGVESFGGVSQNVDTDGTRRINTELLFQLDAAAKDAPTGGVIIIAATNAPWMIDNVIKKRWEPTYHRLTL